MAEELRAAESADDEYDESQPDVVTDEMENMYLNFCLDESTYSIEIRYVQQIVGMQEINEMPEMPPYMKGFINLRGEIIPVISMRIRFMKQEIEYTDRTCIIVTQSGDHKTGLIVDAIKETLTIEPEDIAPPPSTGIHASPYVSGVAKLDSGTSVMIDLKLLFRDTDIPQ
ncbi:MAG: chemotaxis protein CheW [Oscillospiraceae bacterium]|nr:chemotaxis protein CheW [Oscillospiraceae bacterium]